ncbi:MAG: peptidoglycan-binding protein, partial [Sandaracinaceae bacterium]|nr:peptidoglycan-binding protein [Sandaracinaceae bacterium]
MARDHEVRQGECVVSLAFENGWFPRALWEHAKNEGLRARREDMHALLPGDVVHIPDVRPKTETRGTDAKYKFRRRGVPQKLRVQLAGPEGPIADLAYTLEVSGRAPQEGTTSSDGWLEAWIAPNARQATVHFEDGETYVLDLGRLDPIEEPSGVRSRLRNLGFYEGPLDGPLGDEPTRAALRAFQLACELDETGELDDATRRELV